MSNEHDRRRRHGENWPRQTQKHWTALEKWDVNLACCPLAGGSMENVAARGRQQSVVEGMGGLTWYRAATESGWYRWTAGYVVGTFSVHSAKEVCSNPGADWVGGCSNHLQERVPAERQPGRRPLAGAGAGAGVAAAGPAATAGQQQQAHRLSETQRPHVVDVRRPARPCQRQPAVEQRGAAGGMQGLLSVQERHDQWGQRRGVSSSQQQCCVSRRCKQAAGAPPQAARRQCHSLRT